MGTFAKRVVNRALGAVGYQIRKIQPSDSQASRDQPSTDYQLLSASTASHLGLIDLDPNFLPVMRSVKPYTMTSVERMFALYKSVEYVVKARIAGDILESGVWRGGSMMLVASTLLSLGDTSRTLHLFDTYEGHPKPDRENDIDLYGNPVTDHASNRTSDEGSDWGYVSIEEVHANMASTGYPMDKVVLVKGKVEKTAQAHAPVPLSLLRLDTDWYASAKVALETFWPLLTRKGVLIIDDYGHYPSQRRVVDEYFARSPVMLHRVDYSCRTVIKTDDS